MTKSAEQSSPKPHKKRKKPKSTLHWSMELMREEGFTVGKTEHYSSFSKFRVDLFGFLDALCFDTSETVGVQSMVMGDINKHLIKIASLPASFRWLSIPGRRLELHAWGLQGAMGERKRRVLRRIDITTQMLTPFIGQKLKTKG